MAQTVGLYYDPITFLCAKANLNQSVRINLSLYLCHIAFVGEKAKIRVTPSLVSGEENLLDMTVDLRNCMFTHESQDMEMMRAYSQAGCKFECMLARAREECGCTPWEYPHLPGTARYSSFL